MTHAGRRSAREASAEVGAPTREWQHYLAILAAGFVAHGLLLLNDGVYWDGWLIHTYFRVGDWGSMWACFSESGLPQLAGFHWLIGYSPSPVVTYKVLVFLSVVGAALLVYRIARLTGFVSRAESLFIALISLVYPAYQVTVELATAPYSVCYCLFLVACLLALRAETAERAMRLLLQGGAVVCFLLSFTINSLLAFYLGFLALLVIYTKRCHDLTGFGAVTTVLSRRAPFLLLPVLYWVVTRQLFPAQGLYIGYNQFVVSPRVLVEVARVFVTTAVYVPIKAAVLQLLRAPLLWLPVMLLTYGLAGVVQTGERRHHRLAGSHVLLAVGLAILALGVFPYVVVGKAPAASGWLTRHALLVGLPVAVLLVAISRWIDVGRRRWSSRLRFTCLGMLVALLAWSTVSSYVGWQARWAKDRSIMTNLPRLENAERISTFWIDDQLVIGSESYRFYEWSALFSEVWGGQSRIGLDLRGYSADFCVYYRKYFTRRYVLDEFNPDGEQAVLRIRPGPMASSNFAMAMRYLYYRYIDKPKLPRYLSLLTHLELTSSPETAPETR